MEDAKTTWEATLTFDDSQEFAMDFEADEIFQMSMDQVVEVVASDHNKLTNRDLPDQHPVKSITNLSRELGDRLLKTEVLTNTEIQKLLGF